MSQQNVAAVVTAVRDYVRYLQRLGVTELPLRQVANVTVPALPSPALRCPVAIAKMASSISENCSCISDLSSAKEAYWA